MNFLLWEIDIGKKCFEKHLISPLILKDFLGGRGLGVRLFFDYIPSDYFSSVAFEKGPIFFLTGPLTGSKAPLTGRFHSVFHSPLTGTICDSSCGGKAGVFLKSNGIDGIVIKGASETPLYLIIEEGTVFFKDASFLANKLLSEREKLLKEKEGEEVSIILIGPAAEKGVLFANVVCDRRFFGRGGLGHLFAQKHLLAIVVKKGKTSFQTPANAEAFQYTIEEVKKWIYASPITSQGLPEFGTSVLMNLINELRVLPHKNFKENYYHLAENISGEVLREKVVKKRACHGCSIGCGRVTALGEGPEFETLWSLGANLSISDIDFVIEMNELCYQHGVDTITLGSTIASYLEIMELPFGDKELIKELVNQTINKTGEGEKLALGSKRLCQMLGKPQLSMSVKGMEIPAYHPKTLYGMALAYGTSNRGACHLRSYMVAPEVLGIPKLIDPKIKVGKSGLVIYFQNSHAAADSAIFCRFLSLAVTDDYLSRLVANGTGLNITTTDYQRIGERIYVLERLFNLKMNFSTSDDFLPERVTFEGYGEMLKEYYKARGYDEKGVPTEEKIKSLGLQDFS